ncbi:MAG TPA: hypothetical protein VGJ26_13580, partial [Pirellulales bacterium]
MGEINYCLNCGGFMDRPSGLDCSDLRRHHRLVIVGARTAFAILVGTWSSATAWAAPLNPGDIVVGMNLVSTGQDLALVRIDPATGNRTILSDDTTGSGPSFNFGFTPLLPSDVAVDSVNFEPDGSLLVV